MWPSSCGFSIPLQAADKEVIDETQRSQTTESELKDDPLVFRVYQLLDGGKRTSE